MEKKKRDRTVKRNHNLPTYASLKQCNQVNPIAWIGVKENETDTLCSVYTIRKLIVVSTEGVPLPEQKDVSLAEAKAACQFLRSFVRGDCEENIIRATVGKEEYVRWMDNNHLQWEQSMYATMTNEEIDLISLYALFKEGCSSGRPCVIDRVKFGAETFKHWQRGTQPIHCWVNFIDDIDYDEQPCLVDDSNDIPNDTPTLTVPNHFSFPILHSIPPIDDHTLFSFASKLLKDVGDNHTTL